MNYTNDEPRFNAPERKLKPEYAEAIAGRLWIGDRAVEAEIQTHRFEYPEVPAERTGFVDHSTESSPSDTTLAEVNQLHQIRARNDAENAHLLGESGGQYEAA